MSALSGTDLNFVLRRVPHDVRDLMKLRGIFLAGGFIRATVAGEKVSDIDLFGSSIESLKLDAMQFAIARQGRMHTTDNALTVLTPARRLPVQFITKWLYAPGEQEKLLAEFDFTIAQAVIWWDKNGWHSAIGESFYRDLAARRLVYTFPQRAEAAGGSLLRARKFLMRGYNIQAEALAGVISRLVSGVKEDEAFGGLIAELGREKAMAQVMSGLLREVDPLIVIDGVDIADEHADIASETEPA